MSASETIERIKKKYAGRIKIALKQVGNDLIEPIIDLILLRTREEGEGTDGQLKPLKPSTIKYRARYSENLEDGAEPGKSNLTATGQLLNALQGKYSNGKVSITINKKKRKGELSGSSSTQTNEQVREHVEEAGREFLKLSPDEKMEVSDVAAQLIKEKLSKLS